jgi:hypothetical protein
MNYGVDYSFQTQQNRNRENEIQNILMGKFEREEERDLAILEAKYDYNTAKAKLFPSIIRNIINEGKTLLLSEIASIAGVPTKVRLMALSDLGYAPQESNIREYYQTYAMANRDYEFFNALWTEVCQKAHCGTGENYGKKNSLRVYLQILDALKDDLAAQERYERADTAAQERGYENANDAQAIREVEIEWYFNLYGTSNPIEILAYQELERQRYGQTSYEAALEGTELIPINSPQQQEIVAAADPLVDQMLEDTAIYEAEQDRQDKIKKAILIAGGATLVGLFFWSRR